LVVDVDYPYTFEPVFTEADHPILDCFDVASREVTGKAVGIGFVPYGTDGAWINEMVKCPKVIYGPGNISNAHRPNEFVALNQVEEAAMVYTAVIQNYLSQGNPRPSSAGD
jgi:acetylornithine deacetylase